eukprot:2957632-Pyramimonas_sp.AAC.1
MRWNFTFEANVSGGMRWKKIPSHFPSQLKLRWNFANPGPSTVGADLRSETRRWGSGARDALDRRGCRMIRKGES